MPTSTKPATLPTFEVSKTGLAKLLQRRGKEWILGELVQNALDQNVTTVDVCLELIGGGMAEIRVEDDDPLGFSDLSHAFTLFAESEKKGDAAKRGRFNLGEKLVIALCSEARISTTKGEVRFTPQGREMLDAKRKVGSKFEGVFPMTDEEFARAVAFVHTLIIPPKVTVMFNGVALEPRPVLREFKVSLRTEKADAEGILRPTSRVTVVRLYPVRGEVHDVYGQLELPAETAHLYEMGIPVVETGDAWHIDVQQKVPINLDRDNVTPSYLRDLRAHVLNAAHDLLTTEQAGAGWVTNAMEAKDVSADAVTSAVKARFGDDAVIADPTDREGTKLAMNAGMTVVPGAAFSKEAWDAIRSAGALLPAGQVTPSQTASDDDDLMELEYDSAPKPVKDAVDLVVELAEVVLGVSDLTVRLANNPQLPWRATWQRRGPKRADLQFNIGSLGFRWFETTRDDKVADKFLALVIHEFAHQTAGDHLTRDFYEACCRVGATMSRTLIARQDLAERLYGEVAVMA